MLDEREKQPEMDCQIDYRKEALSDAFQLSSSESSNTVSSVTPSTSSASISSAVMVNDEEDAKTREEVTPDAGDAGQTPAFRTGRWTPDEKILFLYGLRMFGKGRWKKMSVYLPQRSLVQIKSHAQKVLKRQQAGENIFRRLEENYSEIDNLVVQAARQRDALRMAGLKVHTPNTKATKTPSKKKRPHTQTRMAGDTSLSSVENVFESPPLHSGSVAAAATVQPTTTSTFSENPTSDSSVLAAAALCQLSSIGGKWDQKDPSKTTITGKDDNNNATL